MTRPSRRRAASRKAVGRRGDVAVVAALLLAGCGVEPQQSPEPVPAERLPSAAASPSGHQATARVRVWGARQSRLVPVFVEVSGSGAGLASRVAALLTLAEAEQRPPTAIRRGTRLLQLERTGDTVELTFNDELRLVPVADLPLALGQIVFTVTEQPDVERVQVRAGDGPVRYVDATGRTIARPLVRADFDGLS